MRLCAEDGGPIVKRYQGHSIAVKYSARRLDIVFGCFEVDFERRHFVQVARSTEAPNQGLVLTNCPKYSNSSRLAIYFVISAESTIPKEE